MTTLVLTLVTVGCASAAPVRLAAGRALPDGTRLTAYHHGPPLVMPPPDRTVRLRIVSPGVTTRQPASLPGLTTPGGHSSGWVGCVVWTESRGQPQVWEPGHAHWGLMQFSYPLWVAYGGNPSTWGNASVAEQWRVFWRVIAAGGQSNWAGDGC